MSLWLKWKILDFTDRLRWLLVILCVFIGLYGLLIYPVTKKQLTYSQNMLNRKLDRLEKRTRFEGDPSKIDTRSLAARLKKIEKKDDDINVKLDKVLNLFAKTDNHQNLLLSLSELAQRTNINVLSQTTSISKKDQTPIPLIDKKTGRPMLILSATSNYWELMNFLEGLKKLNYLVAPIATNIVSQHTKLNIKDDNAQLSQVKGYLKIKLTMSL